MISRWSAGIEFFPQQKQFRRLRITKSTSYDVLMVEVRYRRGKKVSLAAPLRRAPTYTGGELAAETELRAVWREWAKCHEES